MLQIVIPKDEQSRLCDLLEEGSITDWWITPLGDELQMTSVLIRSQLVEPVLDSIKEELDSVDGFRVLLAPLEATHPALPEPDEEKEEVPGEEGRWSPRFGRVSREELIEDVNESSATGPIFSIMVVLSTVVACVGMLKDSPAVIIGAMVIAPLLGPNIALALGTTLGDFDRIKNSIRSNLIGLGIAIVTAVLFGFFVNPDEMTDQLTLRTSVDLGDILLALASGSAGAIAFTSGASATIVGVMVAVALLPPTAAAGMFLGASSWTEAGQAATLAATNIVCINLSATGVFLIQGVRPGSWWEKDRAKSASVRAIIVWTIMLFGLGLLIKLAWG